jgi:hypothetical protein
MVLRKILENDEPTIRKAEFLYLLIVLTLAIAAIFIFFHPEKYSEQSSTTTSQNGDSNGVRGGY